MYNQYNYHYLTSQKGVQTDFKSSFSSAFFGGGFSVDDERTEREVYVRLRGRHLKERSAASPKTSFGVRSSRIHEARKEGVP